MDKSLSDAVEERRSVYAIGKDTGVSDEKIISIICHAVQYAPSAFNSQGARVLVLLDKEHDKLWSIAKEEIKKVVSPENYPATEKKLDSFANGYGTILFFEDQNTVTELQNKYPLYKDNFPVWSMQSSGMLQYSIWTLLDAAGLGVNLQHYNPLIDERVSKAWNIPEHWKLVAEMPFGKKLAEPDPKSFMPIDERIKIYPA